jgi:2,4-dienoyl-CoA reductase-like NADH-dependent reductase (Old Yellow Enzyme family)/thioredoxin reductase
MVSAPLGATDITAEGSPGPRTQGFYEARARGGAAAVTVSELVVHPETDGSQMLKLSLETSGQLAAFTFVADAIKRHGAIPGIELSHSGQYAGTYMVDKKSKKMLGQFGPSDGVRPDGLPVTALNKEQISSIAAAYAEKAALAKRVGFGMVMVHAGHSWLLNQFLSPYFNKRTDEYGGSLKNRLRMTREVLASVRSAVGEYFPIELRLSGSELFNGGYDLAEGVRIAEELEELVDIIHVSAGSYQFGFTTTHPSMFKPHGLNVHMAAEIKKHVKIPVATVGALSDPQKMENIIAAGQADIVAMGRALLADPEIPNKIMANRGADVIKCLRCFVCMAERPVTQTRRCAINPLIGREIEGLTVPVTNAGKKVLVAGGGIAGMKAAVTAALRGHRVTLAEKSAALGGILNTERAVPFKMAMYELGLSYARACEQAGVQILLHTRVDAAFVDEFAPDALIIAVGSTPIKPPLQGIDSPTAVSVNTLYLEGAALGSEVVVLGGGLTGCECALHLSQTGKTVHLVEMRGEPAPDANIRHRPILLAELSAAGIDMRLNTSGLEITKEGLRVRDAEGNEQLIKGDNVVYAVGQTSRSDDVNTLRDGAPWVRVIGDAVRPANITTAIYEAYHAGLDIM